MTQIDIDFDPTEMEPELAVPKHVQQFDDLLALYDDGIEPINSWRTEDVAKALQCFHRELVDRDAAMLAIVDGI